MDMGGVGTAAPGSVTVQSPGACDLQVRGRGQEWLYWESGQLLAQIGAGIRLRGP